MSPELYQVTHLKFVPRAFSLGWGCEGGCSHQCVIFPILCDAVGTAGDSLSYHRGSAFSTKDHDNDKGSGNCASIRKGAWWFNQCNYSDLNGVYYHGQHSSPWGGVQWYHWKGHSYSAKRAEMKIKPVKK